MISNETQSKSNAEGNLYAYEQLANAVVKRAAVDYERALKKLSRHPYDINALKMQNDCERFFQNEIEMYTNLDGSMIMNRIREKVRREKKSRG